MADFEAPPPEHYEDRGPRIPPAKIQGIKATPTISIFYKPDKESPLALLDGKFSRDAAMVFCNRMRSDLMENEGSKSFIFVGGDLQAHKEVLAWIKECVATQSTTKFQELDSSTPGFLTTYANVVLSGYYLGIPARDLSEPLLKRMTAIARKTLMTWDEVEWFYQTKFPSNLPDENTGALREVAATSVFQAWWSGRLDGDEDPQPEEMCILDVLRKENPQLDQDLHELCARNEAEVRRKWEEKDNAKKAGFAQVAADGGGFHDPADTTVAGGWNETDAPVASGGWDTPAAPVASGDWDDSAAPAYDRPAAHGLDPYADEQPYAPPNSLASPDFGGAKNASIPMSPLQEITNVNGFGGGNNGFGGTNGEHQNDNWADEVNEEVVDQGNQYHTNQIQW